MTNVYQQNRTKLCETLKEGYVLLPAFGRMQQTNDQPAPFVQESNFLYLTGIHEPDYLLFIDIATQTSTIIKPAPSQFNEVFYGTQRDDWIQNMSAVEHAVERHALDEIIKNADGVFHVIEPQTSDEYCVNPAYDEVVSILADHHKTTADCQLSLARQRAIKQPYEVELLRNAIDLTCRTFESVRVRLGEFVAEYEIEAEFTHALRRANASHGYQPIVAAGANAIALHYDKNSELIEDGPFVLIDIGARLADYTADITRTYAVRELSDRERKIFEGLQQAHREIIALIRPGLAVREYLESSDRIMQRYLVDIGLLSSLDDGNYRRYFPHAISHGLGLDTHDSLGRPEVFREGMVLTVEPGIYIAEESIGIRIEDNILVTADGNENLSAKLSTDY